MIKAFGDVQICMTMEAVRAQINRDAAVAMEAIEEANDRMHLLDANTKRNLEMAERERRRQEAKTEMLPIIPEALPPERGLSDVRTLDRDMGGLTAPTSSTPVTEDEVRMLLKDAEVQEAIGRELLDACRQRGLLKPSDVEVCLYDPITDTRTPLPPVPDGPLIPMYAKGVDRDLLAKLRDHRPGHLDHFDRNRVGVDPEQPLPMETKADMALIMAHAVSRVRRSERVMLGGALARL
jgi:hypothetical protein